jgi:putative ABC transport system ATP-binding protein
MIELRDLRRTYKKPDEAPVRALDGVSLVIERGEWLSILGPSGSGKSTLMNVIGLLDRPDSGDVLLEGREVQRLSDDELAGLRNRTIGFVFQSYHLLSRTTALENVELPLLYARHADHRQKSEAALAAVGLSDRRNHLAEELSGGQQQRVAIARAIVNRPALLLADEPTGNLDSASAGEILSLFRSLHAAGTTVVLITHDEAVAAAAQRVVRIRDGAIVSDERRTPGVGSQAAATAGATR